MRKDVSNLEQVPFGDYLMDLRRQLCLDEKSEMEFWMVLK